MCHYGNAEVVGGAALLARASAANLNSVNYYRGPARPTPRKRADARDSLAPGPGRPANRSLAQHSIPPTAFHYFQPVAAVRTQGGEHTREVVESRRGYPET